MQATAGSWPNRNEWPRCRTGSYSVAASSMCRTVAAGSPRHSVVTASACWAWSARAGSASRSASARSSSAISPARASSERTLWNSHSPHRTGNGGGESATRPHSSRARTYSAYTSAAANPSVTCNCMPRATRSGNSRASRSAEAGRASSRRRPRRASSTASWWANTRAACWAAR